MASSMQSLKLNIEAGLRSMADEAKQKIDDDLAMGIVSPEELERITADHHATLRTMRQLAEDQFRIALERERQERRWVAGEQLDPAWSESMMKEQQAILDKIEREKKNKDTLASFGPDTLAPPPPPPHVQFQPDPLLQSATPTPVPSIFNRKPDRLSRTPTRLVDPRRDGSHYFSSHPLRYERDELAASPNEIPSFRNTRKVRDGSTTPTSSWKGPSILDTDRSFLDRSKPEPMSPPTRDDLTRKESTRRTSTMNGRPIIQEFWKPPITPEEDAQKSRTFTLARQSSTTSASSSSTASSILSAPFSDPLDSDIDHGRANVHFADQEWNKSRSHHETRLEQSSHSPQGSRRNRESPQLSAQFFPQDLRHYFQQEGGSFGSRPVHTHFEGDGSDDVFDDRSDYNEPRIQDIAEGLRKREDAVDRREEGLARKEYEARRKQEEAERKEEEVRRRTEEISHKAEVTRKKEEELRKREEELRRREDDLNRRESAMRRREDSRLRTREEEIPRQRAGERKKQDVSETWLQETSRPTPSSQTPNASGHRVIPKRNERRGSTSARLASTSRP